MAPIPDIDVQTFGDVRAPLDAAFAAHRAVEAKFVVANGPDDRVHCLVGVPVPFNIYHHAEMMRRLLHHLLQVQIDVTARGKLPPELARFVLGGGKMQIEQDEDRVRAAVLFDSATLVQDVGFAAPPIRDLHQPIFDALKAWAKHVATLQQTRT